ncbi:LemA family protein [Robiginitomaculum antarcticum]|uniref:LemA family protein n=1 Tax=Robiginitomaculum antarcticum TaxID=437507 RepID=UPI00037E4CFD|nr:LemA family protein [Robiginitomaculum antarcticum]
MNTVIILIIAAIVLLGALIAIYNKFVKLRQHVSSGWADIDVQLKRRADLIPNLVSAVKGYAAHERDLFTDIAATRGKALAAGDDTQARAAAESALSASAGRLLAVAEDYPELKASQNFLDLQNELSETEDKIEMSRRYYNGTVRNMNTAAQSFPLNIVAGLFGFNNAQYFNMDHGQRLAPSIDL